MLLSFYRRFSRKTNVPIAVLTAYTEKEYEPFDSYSRYCPAMPVSVCFFDTALCTPGKSEGCFSICLLFKYHLDSADKGKILGLAADSIDKAGYQYDYRYSHEYYVYQPS